MRSPWLLLASLASLSHADSTFSPLRPPAIPLAVRTPYMNTILHVGSNGGNGGYLAGEWPTHWSGQITGWAGFIRVDGVPYTYLGNSDQNTVYVNQTSFEYTSSKSIFTMNVGGKVQMKVTFLSPVLPDDLVRMSLPYNYMNVDVESLDGQQHDVQLYTDISAEWVSGDRGATAEWSYDTTSENPYPNAVAQAAAASPAQAKVFGTNTAFSVPNGPVSHPAATQPYDGDSIKPTKFSESNPPKATELPVSKVEAAGGIAYHKVWRQDQQEFSETSEQANWGYWYYATSNVDGLTHQSGADTDVRGQFLSNGELTNAADTTYRAINNRYPVFAFSKNLGKVSTSTVSTLFQLSLHQKNCINFLGEGSSPQPVPCLWNSYFNSDTAALGHFYNDYSQTSAAADSFDAKVNSDSTAAGGKDYAGITSLAARQAFGAIEYTGTPSQPLLFMKEISSDGNVNTVDVIFPFHPMAIYTEPKVLKWLLDPLFINQENGHWPQTYSIHDIGASYPNAIGHPDGNAEPQPLEECGNMLIMTLAYAQRTQDTAYLQQHYNLLKQWTGYLVNDSLIPANQISTDDFAGPLANQTNLALKGMVGIQAMSEIARLVGNSADQANYDKIAHDYITQWQTLGFDTTADPPHAELAYGLKDSHILLYNLFGDRELGLNLVPQSVYDMQSKFYPTKFNKFGVPLDQRHSYTKGDWEIFCASVASDDTKAQFISSVATWINQTPTSFAFSDLYDTIDGDFARDPTNGNTIGPFISRPVIGGMFALLALNGAPTGGS